MQYLRYTVCLIYHFCVIDTHQGNSLWPAIHQSIHYVYPLIYIHRAYPICHWVNLPKFVISVKVISLSQSHTGPNNHTCSQLWSTSNHQFNLYTCFGLSGENSSWHRGNMQISHSPHRLNWDLTWESFSVPWSLRCHGALKCRHNPEVNKNMMIK